MPARIPQDVDLEDRLVLGLTPVRFGYLVIGGLAAFCVWNARWGPVPARLTLALPLLLGGVTFAWGRWRGRPLDAWVGDLALFLRANVRVVRAVDDRRAPAPPAASAGPAEADPEPLLAIPAPAEVPALPAPSPPDPPPEASAPARRAGRVHGDP
jgi:hypothetical protein